MKFKAPIAIAALALVFAGGISTAAQADNVSNQAGIGDYKWK